MKTLNKIHKVILDFDKERKKRYHTSRRSIFEILIGAILSQRTRDQNTDRASKNLFSVVSKPEDLVGMKLASLQKLIKPSGFYRQKAKTIKKLCTILIKELDSKVPRKREDLIKLPGVGFKTADIVLLYSLGEKTIPVDIHVEVVSKRLGLVQKNAKYEEIRTSLENLFKKKDRERINSGMVEFGQKVCLTNRPKCYICPLVDVCKYDKKNLKSVSNTGTLS